MSLYNNNKKVYKVVFVGNTNTGKTRVAHELYLKQKCTEFNHTPTFGVEVHPVRIGDNIYNIWDTAGVLEYRGLADGYYIMADLFIIFTGQGPRSTGEIVKEITRVAPTAAIYKVPSKPRTEYVYQTLERHPAKRSGSPHKSYYHEHHPLYLNRLTAIAQ